MLETKEELVKIDSLPLGCCNCLQSSSASCAKS